MGAAVLIRALEPLRRASTVMRAAPRRAASSANGPGKLTQALGIELTENDTSLIDGPIRILAGEPLPVRHRPADRDHQGRRAAVALLRARLARRLAAVAAGLCGPV